MDSVTQYCLICENYAMVYNFKSELRQGLILFVIKIYEFMYAHNIYPFVFVVKFE